MAANSVHRRKGSLVLRTYLPSLVVVVLIVVLAAIGWYGFIVPAANQQLAAPAAGNLPSSVTVTASNFAFAVSTNEVATNSTITITFINTVTTPHTFTLSSIQGVAISQSVYANNVSDYFTHHPYYVSQELTSPGQVTFNITAPATGWYEFVCTISGHFGLGMYNAIGFGVPAPANLTGGGTTVQVGWPVYVIAGTIVGLVVLALVLGFVSGQRKGSRHEMPPERLGYPEEPPLPSPTGAPKTPPPAGPPPKS